MELKLDNAEFSDRLDTIVTGLNTELIRVVDTLAQVKECRFSLRAKKPWYNQGIKQQKRLLQKLEKKWLKYKLDSCWTAYKKCRNSYYGRLNTKKKGALRKNIVDCINDTKKLHSLVNNLTSKQVESQWPPHKSDSELAGEFADFFQTKIAKSEKHLMISQDMHLHSVIPPATKFCTNDGAISAQNNQKS